MMVLGLDTALPACSVAVIDGDRVLASIAEPMLRGHQERLAPMVAEAMARAGLPMSALQRVAAGVGPGSFTGLRVGLAFAKALALALDIPCVGIGSLQALAASTGDDGLVAAVVDAKRGQVYLQLFRDGVAISAPGAFELSVGAARLVELSGGGRITLVGSGAALLAPAAPTARIVPLVAPDPAVLARLGAAADLIQARPLYLRAPDARLPS
jgi:tRNA threonylcarbamoyladenosine biosynthesis protein TsaB